MDKVLYAALDAVVRDYPAGIPLSLLERLSREDVAVESSGTPRAVVSSAPAGERGRVVLQGTPRSGVVFIGRWECEDPQRPYTGPAGELLAAAIEKGLRISCPHALTICCQSEDDLRSDRETVLQAVGAESTRVVVLLGDGVSDKVCQEIFPSSAFVRAEALSAIVGNEGAKRAFWQELKKVLKILESA